MEGNKLEIPILFSGDRPYKFGALTWLEQPQRITSATLYTIKIPKTIVVKKKTLSLDAIPMLLETPNSEGMKVWVTLNGNIIARLGEYGALDLVGDKPQYLNDLNQQIILSPVTPFWLRSIMLYIIYD
jgi:hypothetical protein